jgi:selenide,water dikinase
MTTLNRAAAEAMLAAGVRAATDVTGYGLIGHLSNIEGGADIEMAAIPFMNGVRELAARDLFPAGSRRNYEAYRDQVDWGGIPEVDQLLLCDAQTSGGLLVAIPAATASAFESSLPVAARIGSINGLGQIRVRA